MNCELATTESEIIMYHCETDCSKLWNIKERNSLFDKCTIEIYFLWNKPVKNEMSGLNYEIVTTESEILMYHCEIDYLKVWNNLFQKSETGYLRNVQLK